MTVTDACNLIYEDSCNITIARVRQGPKARPLGKCNRGPQPLPNMVSNDNDPRTPGILSAILTQVCVSCMVFDAVNIHWQPNLAQLTRDPSQLACYCVSHRRQSCSWAHFGSWAQTAELNILDCETHEDEALKSYKPTDFIAFIVHAEPDADCLWGRHGHFPPA